VKKLLPMKMKTDFQPNTSTCWQIELNDELDAADVTLEEILDGLVLQFQGANPKFVGDYQNARIIVDTSASHASPNQPVPPPTGVKVNL
jgi:hypothetical protein